tara:strand:+ start:1497 stop:2420 length:924 start_codon:yes stop_codon:yes gene_type:complete
MDSFLDTCLDDLSVEAERKLARTFMGRIEWEMILIGLGQFSIWVMTWFLVVQSIIPLWLGSIIAIITTSCSYLPSHAGQHGHLSGGNKSLAWIDSFVGQISLIPLAQPHAILKATHLKHHAYTNDPKRDPDFFHTHVKNWRQAALKIHNQYNPQGRIAKILETLAEEDPKFAQALKSGATWKLILSIAQIILAILFPLETLLLWWVPRMITLSYLAIFFSHRPHTDLEPGRYKDTRFWTNGIPRFFNHSMQIHTMHHMYPRICHYDEPKAIEALRPFMIERGIPGAEYIPERITLNPITYIKGANSA